MEPSEHSADVFVDHTETTIDVPRPRVLASRSDSVASQQGSAAASNIDGGQAGAEDANKDKFGTQEPSGEITVARDSTGEITVAGQLEEQTTGAYKPAGEAVAVEAVTIHEASSLATQDAAVEPTEASGSSTATTETENVLRTESPMSAATSTASITTKHVTTIYTQRISGRSSSSEGSDVTSPTSPTRGRFVDINKPVFGRGDGAQSPTEVCSVQFSVAAGVTTSTTTAFARTFSRTVETEEDTSEVGSKERHLSECSITIGEAQTNAATETKAKETLSGPTTDNDEVFFESRVPVKSEKDKKVSEYCPGLAIRTLTLQDLQEKRVSPEKEPPANTHASETSTGWMSTKELTAVSDRTDVSLSHSHGVRMAGPSGVNFKSSETKPSGMLASKKTIDPRSLTSAGQGLAKCTEESSSSTNTRKPLFNPIEVERKFTIAPDTEARLKALGARLHKEKVFTDVYYDNDNYDLILSDCWLRKRNDSWEAKVPLKSQTPNALFAPASQYREVNEEKEISAWLVDRLALDSWMRGDPIDLLVQAAGLTGFARFTTTRRSYTLPSCVVDVDLTDHGFKVGEIEVMAASPEEVPHALDIIANVAQELGLSPLKLL